MSKRLASQRTAATTDSSRSILDFVPHCGSKQTIRPSPAKCIGGIPQRQAHCVHAGSGPATAHMDSTTHVLFKPEWKFKKLLMPVVTEKLQKKKKKNGLTHHQISKLEFIVFILLTKQPLLATFLNLTDR